MLQIAFISLITTVCGSILLGLSYRKLAIVEFVGPVMMAVNMIVGMAVRCGKTFPDHPQSDAAKIAIS